MRACKTDRVFTDCIVHYNGSIDMAKPLVLGNKVMATMRIVN